MKLLKTFIDRRQQYLECEYESKYPTYWFKEQELNIWSLCTPKEIRTYVPIGYVYENT